MAGRFEPWSSYIRSTILTSQPWQFLDTKRCSNLVRTQEMKNEISYTAACSDCYLDGVPPWLADLLQVQGFVGGLVVAPLDGQGVGVDRDLNRGGPVCVHLPVLVVVALELKLQVRSSGEKWAKEDMVKSVSGQLPTRDNSPPCRYLSYWEALLDGSGPGGELS